MPAKDRFFISHADEDYWVALKIARELEALGFATFLAKRDLPGGKRYRELIRDRLKECATVIVLITPTSVNSDWVHYEIGAADILEKLVVPVRQGVRSVVIDSIADRHLYELNDIDEFFMTLKEVAASIS